MNHVKVSIYINESDKWQHRPLHIELLGMLDKNEIAGGPFCAQLPDLHLKVLLSLPH